VGLLTVLLNGGTLAAGYTAASALLSVASHRAGMSLTEVGAAINICYAVGAATGGFASSILVHQMRAFVPLCILAGLMAGTLGLALRRSPGKMPFESRE
jgi:hypothetical protein